MAVIDKPAPTYPPGWLKRTGAVDGVVKEDWNKPVKVKPLPAPYYSPARTDYTPLPPAPFTTDFSKKAPAVKSFGFVEFCKLFAAGYFGLLAVVGLYNLLNYLFF